MTRAGLSVAGSNLTTLCRECIAEPQVLVAWVLANNTLSRR